MDPSKQAYLQLSSGHKMPQLGFGTFLLKSDEVNSAISSAIRTGYRHFDCARYYNNEAEIGKVLQKHFLDGTVKREDLFVTTKVWNTCHSYQKALNSIDQSLKDLQLSYVDMCLIHWPMGFYEGADLGYPKKPDGSYHFSDLDYLETWKALEDAFEAGKIKSIGLSNFSISQIQRVIKNARVIPSNLQVELHPYLAQDTLVNWCSSNNIVVTAYFSLGNLSLRKPDDRKLLEEPVLQTLASKYKKTVAQILLRWSIQRGIVVIPKSTHDDRIKENSDIWNFELSDEDMKLIHSLNKDERYVPESYLSAHPHYPF